MNSDWQRYYDDIHGVDIRRIVEDCAGELVRKGSQTYSKCLWHADSHPSLLVGGKYNCCKCMACGHTANGVQYVMESQTLDRKGAEEWIAKQYAITKPTSPHAHTPDTRNSVVTSPKAREKVDKEQVIERILNVTHPVCHSERNAVESKNLTPHLGIGNVCNSRIGGRSFDCAQDDIKDDIISFDYSIAQSYVSTDNSFSQCLKVLFDEATVERVTNDYLLGCYGECGNEDDVLFPSIDANFELRDMKIQHYCTDPASERFFHCDKKHIYWWGSLPSVAEKIPAGLHIDRDCLFGEHLLTKYPDRTVVLVESPKNACIGAALCPEMVWVATGNKTQMKPRVLEALRGRDVLVIPDRDAIEDWGRVISGLGSLANFRMSGINEVLMQGDNEKCDVADIIISNLSS